jgi:hypothetical protein
LLLSFALSACSSFGQKQLAAPVNDPLLGGPPLNQALPATSALAAPVPPPPPVAAVPPAIPSTAGSSTSAAALAAGVPRAFDDNRELRIPPPQREDGGWARTTPASVPVPGKDSGGVRLRGPDAGPEPAAHRDAMQTPAIVPASGVVQDNYKELQAKLASHGVNWQCLQMKGDGEWTFSCTIPNKQKPNVRRKYEAVGRTDLGAIQAVLEQIEKEN